MAKRKQVRPKDRFDIFKRDSFRCQYCGKSPPEAVLVIDHIRPVADGGDNESINLVTSCVDCNQGKAAGKLNEVPPSINATIANETERARQVIEFEKLRKKVARIHADRARECADEWRRRYGLSLSAMETASLAMFLQRLSVEDVKAAIFAASRAASNAGRFKYFCGVCWSKIRAKESTK